MTLVNHKTFALPTKSQGLFTRALTSASVWRERRALSRLSYDALCDIGYSRKQAMNEAKRPFWDVPSNWRA